MGYLTWKFDAEEIEASAIEPEFAEDFYNCMTLEASTPLVPITARNQLKRVKLILKRLVGKRVIPNNPIESFTVGVDENEVIPLELFEVEALYRKQLPVIRLEEVRDTYIFQCFTGFAYTDLYRLTVDNIVEIVVKGEKWLMRKRNKTNVNELVPILPIVDEILEKYKMHPCRTQHSKLLPVKSNCHYNGFLKELAVICGVRCKEGDQSLDTHLARHTFADIMLNNGVPLEDVSRMLGHKSIRTTQKYARIRKNRISNYVSRVRIKLFSKDGKLNLMQSS